jgi:ABC-type multidrug transport system ATPase subunit
LTATVELEGLTKHFDRTLAVAGVDLQIEAGEIFGLVGPNGAGKTTSLRMVAGLLPPVLDFDFRHRCAARSGRRQAGDGLGLGRADDL